MSFNYWIEVCETFDVTNCGVHLFGNCYECKPGYKFDSRHTSCLQVCDVENCTSCLLSDNTVCLTCQPGYQLINIAG